MAYKIQHTNSIGSGTAFGGHTASETLNKIAELRGFGSIIVRVFDVETGKPVEESRLRQRAAQESVTS